MRHFRIIEHIVNDSLTQEEKDYFSSRLINDPSFREEYDNYVMTMGFVNEQVEAFNAIISSLSDFSLDIKTASESIDIGDHVSLSGNDLKASQVIKDVIRKRSDNQSGKNSGWLKAAAVFIITLLVFCPVSVEVLKQGKEINIFRFNPRIYVPVVNRSIEAKTSSMILARGRYFNGDAEAALDALSENGVVQEDQDIDRAMFKAVCLMECGKFSEALAEMKDIPEDCLIYSASLWHKAICYINTGKRDDAALTLDELRLRDPAYEKSAGRLYRAIRKNPYLRIKFNPSERLIPLSKGERLNK